LSFSNTYLLGWTRETSNHMHVEYPRHPWHHFPQCEVRNGPVHLRLPHAKDQFISALIVACND
jgi:hypothetical protein